MARDCLGDLCSRQGKWFPPRISASSRFLISCAFTLPPAHWVLMGLHQKGILLHGTQSSWIKCNAMYYKGDEPRQEGEAKVAYMFHWPQDLMAKKRFNLVSWLANFLIGNCRREGDWGPGLVNSCIHALNPLNTYLMAIDFNALNSFAESRPDWGQSKGLVMQCMNYPYSFRPPAAALKRLEPRGPGRLLQHQCGKLVKGKGQREYLCCAWEEGWIAKDVVIS